MAVNGPFGSGAGAAAGAGAGAEAGVGTGAAGAAAWTGVGAGAETVVTWAVIPGGIGGISGVGVAADLFFGCFAASANRELTSKAPHTKTAIFDLRIRLFKGSTLSDKRFFD